MTNSFEAPSEQKTEIPVILKDEHQEPLKQLEREDALLTEKLSALTDRNLNIYAQELGFDPKDLKDKKILDVGSGTKETFSKEAAEYGGEVYSINPKLKDWKTRHKLQGWIFTDPEWQKRSVASRVQELPFHDETFDMATALWSISYYSFSPGERFKALKEVIRTLKPGGKIFMAPRGNERVLRQENVPLEEVLGQEAIDWLRKGGHRILSGESGPIVIEKSTSDSETK